MVAETAQAFDQGARGVGLAEQDMGLRERVEHAPVVRLGRAQAQRFDHVLPMRASGVRLMGRAFDAAGEQMRLGEIPSHERVGAVFLEEKITEGDGPFGGSEGIGAMQGLPQAGFEHPCDGEMAAEAAGGWLRRD